MGTPPDFSSSRTSLVCWLPAHQLSCLQEGTLLRITRSSLINSSTFDVEIAPPPAVEEDNEVESAPITIGQGERIIVLLEQLVASTQAIQQALGQRASANMESIGY